MSLIVTVTSGNGASCYDSINGNVTSTLPFEEQYTTYSIDGADKQADSNGTIWYNVGTDQFVNDTEVSESVKSVTPKEGTVTITTADKAVLQHSVNGRTIDGRDPLEVGSQWHYTEVAVDAWDQNNYDLGDNQWVQGAYTDDPENNTGTRVKVSFYDPAVLGSDMGYSGVATNNAVFPKGTKLKIVLDDALNDGTTTLERTVNDTGTFVQTNPNQIDIALPEADIPSYGITNATVYVE